MLEKQQPVHAENLVYDSRALNDTKATCCKEPAF